MDVAGYSALKLNNEWKFHSFVESGLYLKKRFGGGTVFVEKTILFHRKLAFKLRYLAHDSMKVSLSFSTFINVEWIFNL